MAAENIQGTQERVCDVVLRGDTTLRLSCDPGTGVQSPGAGLLYPGGEKRGDSVHMYYMMWLQSILRQEGDSELATMMGEMIDEEEEQVAIWSGNRMKVQTCGMVEWTAILRDSYVELRPKDWIEEVNIGYINNAPAMEIGNIYANRIVL
ncbi:uncharacterized protein LACBIDRAFT_325950 [Laccaria bicolor S238N-H82]|uniref:Predicted protein n=1 Tax=Laccaria bicolor (strain S238N-H82 / ATCC MYA-4686) TaxID=486041 RepID=B0D6S8_LACBS|nr:uncharacterized protein LACBIDRAFT_325950 [Laccaria bicolor S238N-H82]EDR09528.1 predicted protein [Laccaria bicolor S238N-H82]|eukprot:XP_001879877.1 predicted protein [Laccaria bicolor S238N-H82]